MIRSAILCVARTMLERQPPGFRARPMPNVAVLLCTYNGAQFLPAQIASLAHQTFSNWKLFVSDDGSSDETLAIVSDRQGLPRHRSGRHPQRTAAGLRQELPQPRLRSFAVVRLLCLLRPGRRLGARQACARGRAPVEPAGAYPSDVLLAHHADRRRTAARSAIHAPTAASRAFTMRWCKVSPAATPSCSTKPRAGC